MWGRGRTFLDAGIRFHGQLIVTDFDALLLVSFGGPEGPADVMPFLRNVTAGRNIPDNRLAVVAEQYAQFGGISPINGQNLDLIDALQTALAELDVDLPIYFGNRNWQPFLADTVAEMAADGVTNALAFATSLFDSYSGDGQYQEDIDAACQKVGPNAPAIHKIAPLRNVAEFVEATAVQITDELSALPAEQIADVTLLFTAHSLPQTMADDCAYQEQLNETATAVVRAIDFDGPFSVVFQSRSGAPQTPWLEPDVGDAIEALPDGTTAVVIPIGFMSDHIEVLYDLDTLAAQQAEACGVPFIRIPTVGIHPLFVRGLAAYLNEMLKSQTSRRDI